MIYHVLDPVAFTTLQSKASTLPAFPYNAAFFGTRGEMRVRQGLVVVRFQDRLYCFAGTSSIRIGNFGKVPSKEPLVLLFQFLVGK